MSPALPGHGQLNGNGGAGPLFWVGAVLAAAALATLLFLLRPAIRSRDAARLRAKAELDAIRIGRRDSVTGLSSRNAFTDTLATRLAAGRTIGLLLINIDNFQGVGDLHGQRVADEVLRGMAGRLQSWVSSNHASLACLGGDQFGVLIEPSEGRHEVEAFALAALRGLATPLEGAGRMFDIQLSIGIAMAPEHGVTADRLMRAARHAQDQVKAAGGRGWRCFDPPDEVPLRRRQHLIEDMQGAIESGEFVPYYQPIVELKTGKIVSFEVLARWDHPAQGRLDPEIFIPIAEELQLAGRVTLSLLQQVTRDSRLWPAEWRFSFNASPGQLRELVAFVQQPPVWEDGMLNPSRIDAEVTESALLEDMDVARAVVAALHARDAHVALDNFGTGTANFAHLRDILFNRIKIDRSFIIGMTEDPRAEACVRTMLALGHSLEIDMVAGGIEDAKTAQRLIELGCAFGQGYFYTKPVPASEVLSLQGRIRHDSREMVA